MPLSAGRSLSHYRILGPLGAGAMGEVYRAQDTRLEREVAIKVLPPELSCSSDGLHRFEREARTLAALSHPNLAHVYGIDRVDDTCFIAMELVPGEDLSHRLSHGALPVAEALDVCGQIAEGVEAAHEAGVIHRDLKPANVVLTPDGRIKLLDFGLAKPAEVAAQPGSTHDSVLRTEEGRLLGTPTYMAPEQLRGKPFDRRIDVWAFGCVLYECLTGRRAFEGDTVSDTLAAVLGREPDWSKLPPSTPIHARRLLERCLDKDPHQRLRDIGEARVALQRGSKAHPEESQSPAQRSHGLAIGALALVLLAIGAVLGRSAFGGSRVRPFRDIRQLSLTELEGMEEMPAVAPDGSKLAFVARVDGKRQVFLRLLTRGTWTRLTQEDDVDHLFPRWADAETLIYMRQPDRDGEPASLWESDSLQSAPRLLLRSIQGEVDVGRQRKRLATFQTNQDGTSLVVMRYSGERDPREYPLPSATYSSPRWSPDDRFVAFTAMTALTSTEIRVLEVASGARRTVFTIDGMVRGLTWLPDGSGLVYSSSAGSTLPYPPLHRLRVVGIDGTGDAPLPCGDGGYASYVEPDIVSSGDGPKLVASRVALPSDIFRYPIDGTPRENTSRELRITRQTALVQVPSVSPDDREVAYLSNSGGRGNIWIARTDGTENPRKLSHEEDPNTIIGIPVWSPGSDWITYWRGTSGMIAEQWLARPDGSRPPHRLVRARGAATWSSDGEWLYYMAVTDDPKDTSVERISVHDGRVEPVRKGASCMLVTSDGRTGFFAPNDYDEGVIYKASPPDTGTAEELVNVQGRVPAWPHMFALSPDDRWLATPLQDDGTTNLWIVSTDDGRLVQVTDFGERSTLICRQVSWSRDSKFLFAAVMDTDADIVLLEGVLP